MGHAMGPTLNMLNGYINSTHTTSLTPYYPPGNLPTPYPLVLFSVITSLLISCYGCKSAIISMSKLKSSISGVRDHPKSPWARRAGAKETPMHDTELEDLYQKDAPRTKRGRNSFHPPPPYMSDVGSVSSAGSIFEEPPPAPDPVMTSAVAQDPSEGAEQSQIREGWLESPSRKIVLSIIIAYSTLRAVTAFIVNVQGLIDKHTSASSPSNLVLLLVSVQILTADYSIPRLLRMVLTLDIILVSLAFVITSFASFSHKHNLPAYGQLVLAGGTCPFYMNNCRSQSSHWDMVGCGNYISLANPDDPGHDLPAPTGFFDPYISSGTLNTKMNPLNVVEAIAIVFGLIWLLTAIFQIYEARYLMKPNQQRRERFINGQPRQSCGVVMMGMTALFGVMGAFVGTFLSIGGHVSQALSPHHAVYMDSIGPAVNVNGTFGTDSSGNQYYTSVAYWGNSTSWSDCFTLTSPTSGNGFWSEWVQQNRASVYRVAAGV